MGSLDELLDELGEELDELKEELTDNGLSDEKAEEVVDALEDLVKKRGETDLEGAEELKKLVGQLGGLLGLFAGGGELALADQLGDLLGPFLAKLLEELLERLLAPGGGHAVRRDPADPNAVEKIKKTSGWDLGIIDEDDDYAPRADILNNGLRSECEGNFVVVHVPVRVTVKEEDIEKVTLRGIGLSGVGLHGVDTVRDGERGRNLPDDDDQEQGKSYDLEMKLRIPCSELYDTLGTLILQVVVEDEDGNIYITHTQLNVRHHLLDDSDECCKQYKRKDLIDKLIERIGGGVRRVDRAAIEALLEKLLERPEPGSGAPDAGEE